MNRLYDIGTYSSGSDEYAFRRYCDLLSVYQMQTIRFPEFGFILKSKLVYRVKRFSSTPQEWTRNADITMVGRGFFATDANSDVGVRIEWIKRGQFLSGCTITDSNGNDFLEVSDPTSAIFVPVEDEIFHRIFG